MTRTSALFGGGGAAQYKSGTFHPAIPLNNSAGATITADRDYLLPFSPRAAVTVSEIAYRRVATTAGNVYVGLYDFAGNLLTDCAVDADTTAGLHAVSTTPVTLLANDWYWLAVNASAVVVNGDSLTQPDTEALITAFGYNRPGAYIDAGADGLSVRDLSLFKARANAALPDPLTITGFSVHSFHPYIGIIVQ